MGRLETQSKKRIRVTKLRSIILSSIQVAGVLTLAALAPKTVTLLSPTKKRGQEKLLSAIQRLEKQGLIMRKNGKLSLTKAGARILETRALKIETPRKWDGRWRVVIFDIPEQRRTYRRALRNILIQLGFMKLQDSVWVHPYDCEELLTLIKTEYSLHKEVLYMIVDSIEQDVRIRRHFSLP